MIILPVQSVYCPKWQYFFLTPEGIWLFEDGQVTFSRSERGAE